MRTGRGLRRFGISIRYKLLALIVVLLSGAIGTYLYLATTLFTADKVAYVYDLELALVDSLGEQTRTALGVLGDTITSVADLADGDEGERARLDEFFARHGELLRVRLFRQAPTQEAIASVVNEPGLTALGLSPEEFADLSKEEALPIEAVASGQRRLHLANVSLPPDMAILSLLLPYRGRRSQGVVAADFHAERLLRLFQRSAVHQTFLVDEHGAVLAHPRPEMVVQRRDLARHPLVTFAAAGGPQSGVREYEIDRVSMLGAFARVGDAGLLVVAQTDRSQATRASRELIDRSIKFGAAILLAAIIVSVFFSRLLTAPILRLRDLTTRIGRGDFEVALDRASRDEIGELGRSFQEMAHALKNTQKQLIHAEKMAAFGQMGAGITHEVKNPLTGVIGLAQAAQHKLGDPERAGQLLARIVEESRRCLGILDNFLRFARSDERAPEPVDLNRTVTSAAELLGHQLNVNNVALVVELGQDVPMVLGHDGELKQVLINLAINAQQAMPGGGTVTLCTGREDDDAFIRVSDTGAGMSEEVMARIFEPFFTTKPAGEGTGLGLSVSYSIIKDHKGSIAVDSTPGKGTTFTVKLPPMRGAPPASLP
jgi:signal transduction histidine kinase